MKASDLLALPLRSKPSIDCSATSTFIAIFALGLLQAMAATFGESELCISF